jgi:hypothetical protein
MVPTCYKNNIWVPYHIKRYINVPLSHATIIRCYTALALGMIKPCTESAYRELMQYS